MKRLILIRHAKSDWGTPALADHDRPLNGRGQRSARAIGHWLREKHYLPGSAYSSTAKRTCETWEGLDIDAPITFTRKLYHAEATAMLEVLRAARANTVLMLGHNPGIGDFAAMLLGAPPEHRDFDRYPTCATLVADFEIEDWADLNFGLGHARDFVVPRELTE